MREIAIVSLTALAVIGCSASNDQINAAAPSRPAPAVTNPTDSLGSSDAATSGSASNAASGSIVTQGASPRSVR
jgi:uncharacterized protein YcfL